MPHTRDHEAHVAYARCCLGHLRTHLPPLALPRRCQQVVKEFPALMFSIVSFGLVFSSNIFGSLFSPNFTFFFCCSPSFSRGKSQSSLTFSLLPEPHTSILSSDFSRSPFTPPRFISSVERNLRATLRSRLRIRPSAAALRPASLLGAGWFQQPLPTFPLKPSS